jgi:hypothetical protein
MVDNPMTMPGFIPDDLKESGGQTTMQSAFIPESPSTPRDLRPIVSKGEIIARGASQGATLGYSDEILAAAKVLSDLPKTIAAKIINAGTDKDRADLIDQYREIRDSEREKNKAAKEAGPKLYMASELGGGVAASAIPGLGAAKGVMTLGRLLKIGAATGAAAGLGSSEADLTKGEIKQAVADTAVGGVIGGTIGAVASPVAKAVGSAFGGISEKLTELGNARLFKAAVGQNKRAFTQMDGKGLLDKAGEYLNKLGIGLGDSTESISKKLSQRHEAIGKEIGDTVAALDSASGGAIKIDPTEVANQIETRVAAPLKKLAAARGEYAQVLDEAKAIRNINSPLTFSEAVEQRAAAQKQINYDVQNGRDIAAQARREIAQIWNDEIDKQAEGLLVNSGKAGNAYRELRHEYSLTTELLKHSTNRVRGNEANRVLSPSDYGVGGIAGIMTSSPYLGVAGAIANHVGRIYGNAAAGRIAINMARASSMSKSVANKVLSPAILASRVPIVIESIDTEDNQ